jgi:uncharacterized protein YbjQ (UPF0145 family)
MDNPFSADKGNPFTTPYQQTPQPAQGIKPFAAVDLAPPAGQNGPRHNAPGNPTASSFTGGDFGSAFLTREAPMAPLPPLGQTAVAPPAPIAAPIAAPLAAPSLVATPTPAKPSPVLPDFSPAPMAAAIPPAPAASLPAAARQSQILSMSDFNDAVNTQKPDFFMTTTHAVDGFPIQRFLGVVSMEIVIPKDLLFRNPAPHGEMHRLKAAEEQLQKVKRQAFLEMGEKAKLLGADGVVGCTLTFSQFDAVVFLCSAVGTAVKLAD